MVLKLMREIPFSLKDFPQFSSSEVGLAVLGHPISHSISPILHNAAIKVLAGHKLSFGNWFYERFDVKPKELPQALEKLSNAGFVGLNLTIPHKVEVLNLLDEFTHEVSLMGASNTLLFRDGKWLGYNTDGYGLLMALQSELGCELSNSKVLILGAGGAARAAAVQVLLSGASRVHIHNRSLKSLNDLIDLLHREFNSEMATGSTHENLKESEFFDQDWIVINATSLGLNKLDPSPLFMSPSKFGAGTVFYDMIYNPRETAYLLEASSFGFQNANGLSMLVYQAVKALEIWSGKTVSAEAMFGAAEEYLGN